MESDRAAAGRRPSQIGRQQSTRLRSNRLWQIISDVTAEIGSDVKAAINSDLGVTIKSDVMGSTGLVTDPKSGGGTVGHRSRLGDGGSHGGWTQAEREAAKGVGSRVDQADESGSALLASIVFDKDNPAGRSNTLHSVVLLRE